MVQLLEKSWIVFFYTEIVFFRALSKDLKCLKAAVCPATTLLPDSKSKFTLICGDQRGFNGTVCLNIKVCVVHPEKQVCHWRWGCWTRLCLCRGRLREDEGLTILNSNKLVGIGFSSSLHCQNIIKFLVFLSFQHLSDDCHHHIIIFVIIYPGFEQRLLVPAHSRHLLQALGQLQPAGGHERGDADADADHYNWYSCKRRWRTVRCSSMSRSLGRGLVLLISRPFPGETLSSSSSWTCTLSSPSSW